MLFHVLNLIQKFQTYWVESSTQSSLVIYNSWSADYPISCHPFCLSVIHHLSRLTMIYFILGCISFYLTYLVAIYSNCITPSHQSIFCIFHFLPFLIKFTFLSMCLVHSASLPFLDIHTADLLSNIIRGGYSGNIYEYLFNDSWINIPKCAKAIPAVHAALCSLPALDW